MHHKVKDLGEDYRARLIKYVEDIAVSTLRQGTGLFNVEYIDVNMLKLEHICLIYRRYCLSLQIRNLHNCKNMFEHHTCTYKIENKIVCNFFCQI